MTIKRRTFNDIIFGTLIIIIVSTLLSLLNIFFSIPLFIAVIVQGLTLVIFGLDEDDIKNEK